MAKLVWRAKLIAELGAGGVSETEVPRIERPTFRSVFVTLVSGSAG
jgi:hypothetical protein